MASQAGTITEKIGIVPPPPGVMPNFENPDYRSGGIVPLAAVLIPLAAIFMILRVYTKLRIIKVFGLEDWTILVAYWGAASVIIYVPAVGLAKVAILLFYLRINPDRHFRITVYITLALTMSYVVALSLTILLQCSPVPAFWNPSIPDSKCVKGTKLYLANAILNVVFDFMVLLVPVPMLLKLQVPTRQKFVIGALFSLGSITCVISAVRIYFSESIIPFVADLTWHLPTPTSFVFVECHLSVICGCLMVLRPFLRRHFPYFLGNAYRRYRSPGGDGGPLGGGGDAFDGPYGPSSRSQYKTKVSANNSRGKGGGGGGGGSGGGGARSWPAGIAAMKHRSHSDDTAVDDELELARWGKHHRHPPPRSESEENIIVPAAEVYPHGYAPGILKTVDVDVKREGGGGGGVGGGGV
ncbi:MAG: hypothetical protein Q9210_006924 [Variospora velana]